ncbi:MAG: hypothetical protein NTV22_12075 [bacterium]|nr:hypothetical protein [bacterium]
MKRIIAVALAASLVAGLALAEGFPAWANNTGSLMTKGLQRGVENMVVSPTEVTHWLFKDCNEYSVVGLVIGPVKGTVYAVGRFLGGLGLLPDEGNSYLPFCVKPIYLERDACATAAAAFPAPQK